MNAAALMIGGLMIPAEPADSCRKMRPWTLGENVLNPITLYWRCTWVSGSIDATIQSLFHTKCWSIAVYVPLNASLRRCSAVRLCSEPLNGSATSLRAPWKPFS